MKAKSTEVNVEVRLPKAIIAVLDAMAKDGIVGNTVEEVALFALRTYMWERRQTIVVPTE